MKKAISIWSFANQEDVRGCISLAHDAGFDGIELALTRTGDVGLDATSDSLGRIRAHAKAESVEIHSVATGLFWEERLTASDAAERKAAVSNGVRLLETASALGADTVLIVPGAVAVDFMPGGETVDYDDAYERSLAGFKELAHKAEELHVNIGIENVWNKFLLSPLEMRDFIDKIGSDYVGSYFDVGNVLYSGYPEQWIKILSYRIKRVHFKDFKRDVATISGFVDLLSGDVDWSAVMAAFAAIGYDGWATAEMLPPYAQYPEQILYNTSASMSKILGGKK